MDILSYQPVFIPCQCLTVPHSAAAMAPPFGLGGNAVALPRLAITAIRSTSVSDTDRP